MMVWGGYLKDTSTKHMPEIPSLKGSLWVNPNTKREPPCLTLPETNIAPLNGWLEY